MSKKQEVSRAVSASPRLPSSKRPNNRAAATSATEPTREHPRRARRATAGSPSIEEATEIVPLWVAESIVNEADAWLRTALPPEWPATFAAKAERCFAGHRQFYRLLSARGANGNAGRDNLRRFMRHWLASRLARERPALYRRLPAGYALGHSPGSPPLPG